MIKFRKLQIKIKTRIESVVKNAGLKPADVNVVSLTGGTSKIPYIRAIFEKMFGKGKIRHINAFTSVAHGLGIYGNLFI